MKDTSKKGKQLSRRGMLPLLGTTLLIPFLGFGSTTDEKATAPEDEDFQTLMKPDGTVVKVRKSTLQNSKVVKENISNRSFFNWLGKK